MTLPAADPVRALGARIEETLDALPSNEAEQRRRLRELVAEVPPAAGRSRLWLVAAGAASVAAAAVIAIVLQSPGALHFEIEQGDGLQGTRIATQSHQSVVRFEDDTRLTLAEHSSAEVVEATREAVRIRLDSGRVRSSVTPDSKRTWSVLARGYAVTALGTVFDVATSDGRGVTVSVERGRVLVTGPELRTEGVIVAAGQRLALRFDGVDPAVVQDAAVQDAAVPIVAVVADLADDDVADDDHADAGVIIRPKPSPAQKLAALVARGALDDALAILEHDGVAVAPDDVLVPLAERARLQRKATLAAALYERAARRIAGEVGANAAFQRGRLAAVGGDVVVAVSWLTTSLQRAPDGAFAAEARGLLLDCAVRKGDDKQARQLAQDYLQRHPEGAWVGVARSTLAGAP